MSLATNKSILPSSSRSAADDTQTAPVVVDEAGLLGHVDKPAAVVAEDVVRQRVEAARVAVSVDLIRPPAELHSVGLSVSHFR